MRVALHTKVRADRIAEYEAAHREVPEELTAAIRAAGATSWTIWRSGTDLFHLLECDGLRPAARRTGEAPRQYRLAGPHGRTARRRTRLLLRTAPRPDCPSSGSCEPMAIIDAHHHVWDLSVRDQDWITGPELAPIRRNFTARRPRRRGARGRRGRHRPRPDGHRRRGDPRVPRPRRRQRPGRGRRRLDRPHRARCRRHPRRAARTPRRGPARRHPPPGPGRARPRAGCCAPTYCAAWPPSPPPDSSTTSWSSRTSCPRRPRRRPGCPGSPSYSTISASRPSPPGSWSPGRATSAHSRPGRTPSANSPAWSPRRPGRPGPRRSEPVRRHGARRLRPRPADVRLRLARVPARRELRRGRRGRPRAHPPAGRRRNAAPSSRPPRAASTDLSRVEPRTCGRREPAAPWMHAGAARSRSAERVPRRPPGGTGDRPRPAAGDQRPEDVRPAAHRRRGRRGHRRGPAREVARHQRGRRSISSPISPGRAGSSGRTSSRPRRRAPARARSPCVPSSPAGGGFDLTEAGTTKRLAVHLVHDPAEVPGIARLGPDPLADGFDRDAFAALLAGERRQIKGALRDQSLIAGIGNAYSDEILHAAKMSPFKPVQNLDEDEITALYEALRATLREAVERSRGVAAGGSRPRRRAACASTAAPVSRARSAATPSARSPSATPRCSTAPPARPAASRSPTAGSPAC